MRPPQGGPGLYELMFVCDPLSSGAAPDRGVCSGSKPEGRDGVKDGRAPAHAHPCRSPRKYRTSTDSYNSTDSNSTDGKTWALGVEEETDHH